MTTCHGRLLGGGRLPCLLFEGVRDARAWSERSFWQQDAGHERDDHHRSAHEVDPSDAERQAVDDGGATSLRQRLDLGRLADQARRIVGGDSEAIRDLSSNGRVEDRAEGREPE